MKYFNKLNHFNVNDKVDVKRLGGKDYKYLSWAWAWAEFVRFYPNAQYEIVKNENNLPYFDGGEAGVMVYTKIRVEDIEHEMWMPILDGANKPMKSKPYKYTVKYNNTEKTVSAFSMFDVNKAIMRCLVKNMAIFGLGLYIYAKEDLPDDPRKILMSCLKDKYDIRGEKLNLFCIVNYINHSTTNDEIIDILDNLEAIVRDFKDMKKEELNNFVQTLNDHKTIENNNLNKKRINVVDL